jgi:NAD(P)-dependent dehydrogenase (short-subunit alcohol dehydrogenase family)
MASTNDRTAIITGGSRGLGRNTAVNMARRGVDIIFTYHSNSAEAQSMVREVETLGRKATGVVVATPAPVPYSAPAAVGRVASEFRNIHLKSKARIPPAIVRACSLQSHFGAAHGLSHRGERAVSKRRGGRQRRARIFRGVGTVVRDEGRLDMNIANKTILITGANRGIGRALVNQALKRGAKKVYAGTRGSLQVPDERATPITLDVTSDSEIQRAADRVDTLDVLINDAGISLQDDLSNPSMIHQHLAVNCFGLVNVTRAFVPLLTQSKGAVVNILSLASIASVPFSPAYAISKAAAFSATQSLRMLLARKGVTVHAVFPGPVDTDMTRDLELPKASAESVAVAIFDGVQNGDEDIFPDSMSQSIAEGWRTGVVKALERQFTAFVPQGATNLG